MNIKRKTTKFRDAIIVLQIKINTQNFRDAIVLQIKLRSLILDLVHMLDVVRKLANAGVNSIGDWLWQKQLRFYLVNNVSFNIVRFCSLSLPKQSQVETT